MDLRGLAPIPSLLAQSHVPGNVELAASVCESICAHHAPSGSSLAKIADLRICAARLMESLLETSLPCPERSTAIAKVREALMWGNAAIIFTQPVLTDADAEADLTGTLRPHRDPTQP